MTYYIFALKDGVAVMNYDYDEYLELSKYLTIDYEETIFMKLEDDDNCDDRLYFIPRSYRAGVWN